MPDQVGHDGRGRSGTTAVEGRPDGLEVKRNFALHEKDRLAGDEDAGRGESDAEGAAAGGELPCDHFGLSQFVGPEGGQVGVGAAGDGVFGDVEFGVEAAGDEVVILGLGRNDEAASIDLAHGVVVGNHMG